MIFFKNYFFTPSGRKCILNEIKNDSYFILLKYIQAQDYSGFFSSLDSLILETIPDFLEFDILDKASIYLAMSFYSVHNSIFIGNKIFGTTELNLNMVIDAIEEEYKSLPKYFNYSLDNKIDLKLSLPKVIDADHKGISINYISGIQSIKNIPITTLEEINKVSRELPTRFSIKIEQIIKKHYSQECTIYEDFSINLISPEIFYLIFQVYSEKLEDYYELLYYLFEYLKWDYNTYSKFTPLETRALFNLYKEDKEKQAQEREMQLRQ